MSEEHGFDAVRLSRRNAMRAAVATATVVGVWSAPRIEGLSIVPDYAAAATCSIPNGTQSTTKNSAFKACGPGGTSKQICWGNAFCSGGGNAGTATCGTANGALPALAKPNAGNISLNYSVAGAVYNGNSNTDVQSANSRVFGLSLTGMDANVQSCTLDVTGGCSTGSFRAGTNSTSLGASSSEVRTSDGSFGSVWLKCVGTSTSGQTASFTLTLTCSFNC